MIKLLEAYLLGDEEYLDEQAKDIIMDAIANDKELQDRVIELIVKANKKEKEENEETNE